MESFHSKRLLFYTLLSDNPLMMIRVSFLLILFFTTSASKANHLAPGSVFKKRSSLALTASRQTLDFNEGWSFFLGDDPKASEKNYPDQGWRKLNLPHDFSIEGSFSKSNPAGFGAGALPGGTAWYRKSFSIPLSSKGKYIALNFDGVYRNSEVWVNGHLLGKRPNGYIAFQYELSTYLNYGGVNIVAVRVDNSKQPNSRWYTGSGIYRDVKLISSGRMRIAQWGNFVSTPIVSKERALVKVETKLIPDFKGARNAELRTLIYDQNQRLVASQRQEIKVRKEIKAVVNERKSVRVKNGVIPNSEIGLISELTVLQPYLWSDVNPYLYQVQTQVWVDGKETDREESALGIRSFSFDADRGFVLNGNELKIRGVCNHHDLGALGAAFNVRAAERQLELLKKMGCNGIRTSHNPPASALLDLCDRMGFIVMDEAFDMWAKKKTDFDYHLDWEDWHKRDLEDLVLRDRNHPSVFIWSTGNEIQEQWGTGADTAGRVIARELTKIVRSLDPSRPVTIANNEVNIYNNLIQSGAMDIIGYNYNHDKWKDFNKTYPGKKLIATETTSALQTRGHYDLPSDSMRIWPTAWDQPLLTGNKDLTCSAYDNCHTPWGSTHEQTLQAFEFNPAVSGMYVWTGFDYLGEPTPYEWPARSSYFGIMDLAGFPKDVYHLYQSVWTDIPVLHVFPHWNWKAGQLVDVWAYYSQADEVELFLNGKSLGVKKKTGQEMKVSWKVNYEPGTLKAISRKDGRLVLERTVNTAGKAAQLALSADRIEIKADGKDLSYVTVKVLDQEGNLIPDAMHSITFEVEGPASIVGIDNGSPTSHESFQFNSHQAFNGLVMVILKTEKKEGKIRLQAKSVELGSAGIILNVN